MRGARAKLTVLAELAGGASADARVWSLRRADLEALETLLGRLAEQRVVLVVGEEALAGAVALAGAASASGRRTALLECDLSRPRLATELGLAAAPGLHEYLRWEATAAEILQPLTLAGPAARRAAEPLVCVAGGGAAKDPATLLSSQSFRHATAKLRRAYDLVVLGGPALGLEQWPLEAVASTADAVLVCVPPSRIRGRPGRALRTALRPLPIAPLGAIVVGEG
jgi:Mrp family chromosome partitioning ATPase